jgi:hypothetical protein
LVPLPPTTLWGPVNADPPRIVSSLSWTGWDRGVFRVPPQGEPHSKLSLAFEELTRIKDIWERNQKYQKYHFWKNITKSTFLLNVTIFFLTYTQFEH